MDAKPKWLDSVRKNFHNATMKLKKNNNHIDSTHEEDFLFWSQPPWSWFTAAKDRLFSGDDDNWFPIIVAVIIIAVVSYFWITSSSNKIKKEKTAAGGHKGRTELVVIDNDSNLNHHDEHNNSNNYYTATNQHLQALPKRPTVRVLFQPDNDPSTSTAATTNTTDTTDGSSTDDYHGDIHHYKDQSSVASNSTTKTSRSQFSNHNKKRSSPSDGKSDFDKFMEYNISTQDLPDSFAPLLSSKQMKIMTQDVDTDLLHSLYMNGSLTLKCGKHELPLPNTTNSSTKQSTNNETPTTRVRSKRPPLTTPIVTKDGINVSFQLSIHDNCHNDNNHNHDNNNNHNSQEKKTMVQSGLMICEPAIPLMNVAPTLIHFPTLFQDTSWWSKTVFQFFIIRIFIRGIQTYQYWIEQCLWWLERHLLQIHLSTIQITPTNNTSNNNSSPRLICAFSGHVLVCSKVPIPFVRVRLPSFIIPQPHAALEQLCSSQPLASAKIANDPSIYFTENPQLILTLANMVQQWSLEVQSVTIPPILSMDWTLPGGLTVAMESSSGIDLQPPNNINKMTRNNVSGQSLSSWTTSPPTTNIPTSSSSTKKNNNSNMSTNKNKKHQNKKNGLLMPWKLNLSVKGRMDPDLIHVSVADCRVHQQQRDSNDNNLGGSQISLSGNCTIHKPSLDALSNTASTRSSSTKNALSPKRISPSPSLIDLDSSSPSIISTLLFPNLPEEQQLYGSSTSSIRPTSSSNNHQLLNNLLMYEYAFDIGKDTHLDAVTVTIGAHHPMLKGGTIITTVLETVFAHGSLASRKNAMINMNEISRKRNILRHLPAIDLLAGINNIYIPKESYSFSDDGQTKCLPEMNGGRMMIRINGGDNNTTTTTTMDNQQLDSSNSSDDLNIIYNNSTSVKTNPNDLQEGLNVVVDFGVASFVLNNEGNVNEFPELDIFEGDKLQSLLSGTIHGRIACLLRPLSKLSTASGIGRNIFNPLEAYEIDFSDSCVSLRMKEANATLGHRRLILPTESNFTLTIVESIVDMSFDGKTQCEFLWDFQGSSPILQVTSAGGQSPAFVSHEDRKQVSLLISDLRQGRFNLNVSSVGGITITEAKTSRDNREGLYDWKFFNAIVSPDNESPERIYQVLHDKRTMNKLLQVVDLINADLCKILKYILKQVWRAKEILDQEGVSDPGQAIPGHKMARLVSLFLTGDVSEVNQLLPIIRRVVAGEGLDVVTTKELLRKHLSIYEDWAAEIDRAVRWTEVMFGPMEAAKPYVEKVPSLSDSPHYEKLLRGIPSAKEIYSTLLDKCQLPLDPSFSSLVGELAPYLTFSQIQYILRSRPSNHWQSSDLRRLRYVFAIKRKVLEISESYGGISFLPQSFFVSVFVGEASRSSLRSKKSRSYFKSNNGSSSQTIKASMISTLRQRRIISPAIQTRTTTTQYESELEFIAEDYTHEFLSPAARVASVKDFQHFGISQRQDKDYRTIPNSQFSYLLVNSEPGDDDYYELGDSLLGPQDVAILLQAGLTSSMKNSTAVQLNQRMLLDLMAGQPTSFVLAVLSEIGTPGVAQSSPRALTSALMALLDLDQSSFREFHRLDMHALLESWLPGLKVPRREDYLAGGRWARQSYYNAIFAVAKNILEDAESYIALKGKIQRVRYNKEQDPVPQHKKVSIENNSCGFFTDDTTVGFNDDDNILAYNEAVHAAKKKIKDADEAASKVVNDLKQSRKHVENYEPAKNAIDLYQEAFKACANVLKLDKLSFQADWFKEFYRRNYDALMVKSIYDNVKEDVDEVRQWLDCLKSGILRTELKKANVDNMNPILSFLLPFKEDQDSNTFLTKKSVYFSTPNRHTQQELIDGIIDVIFYNKDEREFIRCDPLVRLLISNKPGNYNMTIVSAMGVITEGKQGLELEASFKRLEEKRGVKLIRADTGTARSLEYNAAKIEEAIQTAVSLKKPYGLLGYSQGCANALTAESILLSGTPHQQGTLTINGGLICRQLIFSAANGSMHGPAMDAKANRLIIMCEEFFKYQQGYCSRAFISTVLEILTNVMDSPSFQKIVCGGGGTFLQEGNRAFWREAQHLAHVPTSVIRGVLEDHTTPESLDMISNLLTKQAGSALHDSQVHVYDAVGYPVYTHNRNGRILKNCDMGGAIQRTHHWSPLSEEVDFVKTKRDEDLGSFISAKDRHIFPWVDVNARFGIVQNISAEDQK